MCSSAGMKRPLCMRSAAGLTLVEVIVTVAILAVLWGLAAPSFKPLLDRWRVQQAVGAMTGTLRLARSEAIQRGGEVVVQKIARHTDGCTLAATPADWGCGWMLFVDSDASGSFTAGEEVLQSVRIPPGISVVHRHGAAAIRVDRWGKMDGLNAKSFLVAPHPRATASSATRSLCVAAGGRIRIAESASC